MKSRRITAALITLALSAAVGHADVPSSVRIQASGSNLTGSWFSGDAVSLRWRKDGVAVATGSAAGSFTSTYAVSDPQTPATYTLEVTNASGTTTSTPVGVVRPAASPPWISRQSSAVRLREADSAISVIVVNDGDVICTWYRDGVVVDGPKTVAAGWQFLKPASTGGAGNYTLVAANAVGSTTSRTIAVLAYDATTPAFNTAPEHRAIEYGEELDLAADVSAPPDATFQWKRDGAAVAGATNSSYSVASYTPAFAGRYALTVTAGGTSITSPEGIVETHGRESALPALAVQPSSAGLHLGESVTLGVVADAGYDPVYQWLKDGQPLAGETGQTLFLPAVSAVDAGSYTVKVANEFGAVTSRAIAVTVADGAPPALAPLVLPKLGDQTVALGQPFSVMARIFGSPAPSVQWYRNGAPVAGATSASYERSSAAAGDAGTYRVVATNANGSVGAFVGTVYIDDPARKPRFTFQPPAKRQATLGGTIQLLVAVEGNPTPTLTWFKDGVPVVADPTRASTRYTLLWGAQKVVGLRIDAIGEDAAGTYTVAAENDAGRVVSTPIVLTVAPQPAAGIYFTTGDGTNTRSLGAAVLLNAAGQGVLVSNGGRFQLAAGVATIGMEAGRIAGTMPISGSSSTGVAFAGDWFGDDIRITRPGAIGDTPMLLARSPLAGAFADVAGYWSAPLAGDSTGTADAIVDADGRISIVIARTNGTAEADQGHLDAQRRFAGTFFGQLQVQFGADGTFSGTVLSWRQPGATFAGVHKSERLFDWMGNISARARVGGAAGVAIAGFSIGGGSPRPVLIRAVGPTLKDVGVPGALADPRIDLYRGSDVVASNDNWTDEATMADAVQRVSAFGLKPGSRDAALLVTLDPGTYTAHVTSAGGGGESGVALVEVYDSAGGEKALADSRLANLSTRAFVGTNDDVLVGGVVVLGSAPKRVLIRAIGPTLAASGVANVLADPVLRLYQGDTVVAENDDWSSPDGAAVAAAAAQVQAFDLATGTKDAAMVVTLAPGTYTAQVSGFQGGTGVALLEAYELP